MKCRHSKIIFFILAALSSASGNLTVHILNPWAGDSVRANSPVYIQSSETGWYPGMQMTPDFGNWLTYTFNNITTTTNDRFQLMSVIPTSDNPTNNRLNYSGNPNQNNFQTLFAGNEDATDIWILVTDTTKPPQVQFTSPPYNVIRFFRPWKIGGAYVEIKNIGSFKMKGMGDYCGWLTYKIFADTDSLFVKFYNSLDSTAYSSAGPGDGEYIDLSTTCSQSDTAWVLASLAGPPSIESDFPGTLGDCSPAVLASKLRDISDSTHPDFNKNACFSDHEAFTRLVRNRLGSDGKPVKSDEAYCIQQFDWFDAKDLGNGYYNEQCFNLILHKNDEGLYEYDANEFFPLDSFQYLDENNTIENPNGVLRYGHNFSFTMETGAEFEYVKGQQFYFRGDDDVWVFIDSQLVVDLSGVHYPIEGSVDLDTLGLTPGKTYSFKLFFSERNCCGSSFRMVTSIALRTSSKLFHEETTIAPGTIQYDIYEKITQDNMACDASIETPIDTIKASVEFFIDGPPFTSPLKLPSGVSYGGITINKDYTGIVIDRSSITGLAAGDYRIHYCSTNDRSMGGVLTFTVNDTIIDTVTELPRMNNTVESAAYFSDNGRGSVDRAEIYFTDTLETVPDSLLLCWPSIANCKSITADVGIDSDDKRHVTVRLSNPFPGEITTGNVNTRLGTCCFHDSNHITAPPMLVSFSITDSVGPLVESAVLIERIEPGNDTLLLTFSESVKNTELPGEPFILFKNGKKVALTIVKTFKRNDTTVIIIKDQKENAPGMYDSISLNHAGPVSDEYGNTAHPDNRPVPFIMRKIPGKVFNAYYLDSDADGIIDKAILQYNKGVVLSEITVSFTCTWNNLKTVTLDSNRFSYGKDSAEVHVALSGAFPQQPIRTSGVMYYHVEFTGEQGRQSSMVDDRASPVLTSVELSPGTTRNGSESSDTLTCIFSERIRDISCINPFLFLRDGSGRNTVYQMSFSFISNSGNTGVFLVNDIDGVEYPENDDSIWINTTCGLSDMESNRQENPRNHRVALKVKPIPVYYDIKVGPNPLHRSDPANPTVIKIEPSCKLIHLVKFSADIFIYDPVGNVVYRNTMESHGSPTTVSFKWDGHNRNGRIVGTGTYLAMVKIHDLFSNGVKIASVKIGVVE